MPDITSLLQRRARETGVRLDILEKDYALSYLLKAIALGKQKCAVRDLTFDEPADFFAEPLLQVARAEWQAQILPFVSDTPAPEQVLAELKIRVQSLWG